MQQFEKVLIGVNCFLLGSLFEVSKEDFYFIGPMIISWTIYICTKQVIKAMSKMRYGIVKMNKKMREKISSTLKGEKNVMINGSYNVIRK